MVQQCMRSPATREALEKERQGLPCFATGCVEVRAANQTGAEWGKLHPSVALDTRYRHEEMLGQRLMFAERRTGVDYALERPIKEVTPEGWIRTVVDYRLQRI
jgi:hypothetical protein